MLVTALLIGFIVVMEVSEHFDRKRLIKELLVENDQMWNDLIREHQEEIAKAYLDGYPYTFKIKRD